ncbi:RNA polymerase factor sigma-54 [Brachyspira aalborgi]|uniref:RNA polymerase sigma-54 factor n=1 Tax=Brachyspira aalborgi TaxID=29522 RepID=A0AB38Q0I9_9SPIR|nr:RNA polymerase factor sigma-54 [Brachyspira aalborgi]TXJ26158.1 RNA polymerase sigma-54 factor [Brachyspira aalborgi]TXJ30643.1 RNA polymerase sigma-54 factor [Brachyspira aalborgi]TXJ45138.1 RNA polymerase sigma-54 factor [Brachyspira aalborgi]
MRNSINTSINTSIRNELKLNSQTKLWLNIISIPAIELKEKIEKAIEENPFLEYDIKSNHNNLDINSIIENTASNSKESLFEHLKSQISIVFNNKKDIELAELISTFINENGYLTISSEEIADILNISAKKADEIIKILKTLEPIGIAAKNISECLSTQLKNKENIDKNIKNIAINIVENYLNELSKKDYKYISSKMNISEKNILEALKLIQTLEPYPAREFDTTTIKYIVPELFIFKENNKWQVKTNETFILPLKINKKYSKILKENNFNNDILKEKKLEAQNLISTVNERKKSLKRVGEGLLKLQIDFFENGKEFMKPLRLKDLALETNLSESSISRISNGKYLNTVWGTFSIKYFFSKNIKAINGELGSRAVKEIIKRIIENSNAKLSDEKIRLILKSEGIEIARRTVAKYRQSMNIIK